MNAESQLSAVRVSRHFPMQEVAPDGEQSQTAPVDAAIEIFELMPACIECIDRHGLVAYQNPMAASHWRSGDTSDAHAAWLAQWAEASRAGLRDALQRAQAGRRCSVLADRVSHGQLVQYDVTISPIANPRKGWELLTVATPTRGFRSDGADSDDQARRGIIDLLARQLTEDDDQLRNLRTRLYHAEKMKLMGHYVTQIVHDLNNVFHVLDSSLRLLGTSKSNGDRWIDAGKRAVIRGTQLMRRLLDFARREEDLSESIDLADLIEGQRTMLASLLNNDTEFHLRLGPALWPVSASKAAIGSVLFNLVANARDAMQQGGACIVEVNNCDVSELPEPLSGDYVRLSVSDTGCGIPAHILAHAGDFYHTTKRNGTGLGLASAYDLARLASGCVRIQSEAGKGTTICLYLRRAGLRNLAPQIEGVGANAHLHGNACIMVAHPEPAVRAAVSATLRALDYRVLEAPNKALAAALLDSVILIDLIISDGRTRSADTGQRLSGGGTHGPAVPVIWLDDTQNPLESMPDCVLRGPLYMPVLLRAILEGLNRLPALRLSRASLAASEKVRRRLKDPRVRDLFDMWQNLVRASGHLPSLDEVLQFRVKLDAIGYVVQVENDGPVALFKVVQFGKDLAARLGRDLTGCTLTAADEDMLGSLSAAWTRCLTGAPHFDYARLRFDGGPAEGFERLLLPASDNGESVTHLIGVTAFEGPLPNAENGGGPRRE